jgi:SAM-dependent methyltransferase
MKHFNQTTQNFKKKNQNILGAEDMFKELKFNKKIEKLNRDKSMDNDIKNYWKVKPGENSESTLAYMNWFDKCNSLQEYQKTGCVDFFHRIFVGSTLYDNIGDPGQKKCLEIGFGGGRLLNSACKVFDKCYGIDIHESFEKTQNILESLGNNNFELIPFDDLENTIEKINLKEKIDFIYSFIVFQHFDSWEIAENYLKICKRLLSKNGCAKIFFGKNMESNEDFIAKPMYEPQAYTLLVNPDFAIREISKYFDVLEAGVTMKKPWSKTPSGQFFVTFKQKS